MVVLVEATVLVVVDEEVVVAGGAVVVVVVSGLIFRLEVGLRGVASPDWVATILSGAEEGGELYDVVIRTIVPRHKARISHLPEPECFEAYATDRTSPVAAVYPTLPSTKCMVLAEVGEPCHPATVTAPDVARGRR